jgi:ABC-type transport system involved in multi-copper enzyme maturation permease subunit
MMLWYKAWRESRVRFAISATALAGFCLLIVIFHEQIRSAGGVPPGMRGHSYSEHIYNFIYGTAKGIFLLFVLPFLGLGGLLREKAHRTVGFTLALPVSRLSVIGAHVGIGLLEVAALALIPALIVPAISPLVHESYPFSQALHFSVLWLVCGAVVFASAFLLSVVLSGDYSAPVAYIIIFFLQDLILASAPLERYRLKIIWIAGEFGTMHWDAQRDLLLSGPLPWLRLLTITLVTISLLAIAAQVTQRQDF